MLKHSTAAHQMDAVIHSNHTNRLIFPTNIFVDEEHLAIKKLLYGDLSKDDCVAYNDPLFIKRLRNRALDGIKDVMSKVSYNALKTQSHTIFFSLTDQFQTITLLSQIRQDDFALYVKAQENSEAQDVNVLEYAAITGFPYLFQRFSLFGVESEHLQQLLNNVEKIYHTVDNEESKQEIKKIAEALKNDSPQIIEVKMQHSRLAIVLRNHKKGLIFQGILITMGVTLFCIALDVPQIRDSTVALGFMVAAATALVVDGGSNTFNMFTNTTREDYMVNQNLHKAALAELFNHVFNLSQSLDLGILGINATTLLSKGGIQLSWPQPQPQPQLPELPINTLPLVNKPQGSTRKLIFSMSNLDGLRTGSQSSKPVQEHGASVNLRHFDPEDLEGNKGFSLI